MYDRAERQPVSSTFLPPPVSRRSIEVTSFCVTEKIDFTAFSTAPRNPHIPYHPFEDINMIGQASNDVDEEFYQRVHNYLTSTKQRRPDEYGRAEYVSSGVHLFGVVKSLILTVPYSYLAFQFIWTGLIVGLGYYIGSEENGDQSTLSTAFWNSRLGISSNVSFGVGWALFVLLGFFISAASSRYYKAQKCIASIGYELERAVRCLYQGYKRGAWHKNDYERIVAHMIAYPIALKMHLRNERDEKQLTNILNRFDVEDVMKSSNMHLHCTRVVRGYFGFAESISCKASPDTDREILRTIGGYATRYYAMDIVDNIDSLSTSAMTILKFQPSVGYVNHLRIYLYIWMMFLPFSLITECGWFTMLWSLAITFFVSKCFTIANALNDPFGFDLHDIKLNEICFGIAQQVLEVYGNYKINYTDLIDKEHDTPSWLQEPVSIAEFNFSQPSSINFRRLFSIRPQQWKIATITVMFILWNAFVVLLSWLLTRDEERAPGVRWWSIYIPVTTNTTSFVSVGLFLLIGFWLNDAYGKYWRGLQIWQNEVRPSLENLAHSFPILLQVGAFHQRDRERILSFISAVPYFAKMKLREDYTDQETLNALADILSQKDLECAINSQDPMFHVFSNLYSYLNAADFGHEEFTTLTGSPYFGAVYTFLYSLWGTEQAIDECMAIKNFPISVAFTVHLRLFTAFWLALLPPAVVLFGGFTTFAYLVPVAYAISNLLILGDELSDPFGNDAHDIPLDRFCLEIRNSVHRIYQETLVREEIIHPEVVYDRREFPSSYTSPSRNSSSDRLTFKKIVGKVVEFLPGASKIAMVITTLWTVGAVLISWRLSKLWDDDRNMGSTQGWESPIDVSGSIIGSMGFALFLILAFAASDGMGRYDQCARLLCDLERHLRWLTTHVINGWEGDSYHKYDKERLVAHLVQIPLCFRDILLERGVTSSKDEGVMAEEDKKKFENSLSSLDYLINTVQSYAYVQEINITRGMITDKPIIHGLSVIYTFAERLHKIRLITREAISAKRYPLVGSYQLNMKIFTGLWLAMLPFSMTRHAGFYTILWVPFISFGLFGMQNIAEKLVDPIGNDSVDVPVEELCSRAADSMLHLVSSSKWDCDYHRKEMPLPDRTIQPNFQDVINGPNLKSLNPDAEKIFNDKKSLLTHFIFSVPWWQILLITTWAAIACVISFVSRKNQFDDTAKWWIPNVAINDSVSSYMSTATFTLLGFYVNTAYARYYEAGSIWTEQFKAACHNLTRGFRSMTTNEIYHKNDHQRIVGHLIALPIVLKEQLRESKDIHALKDYLSHEDIGRIECSPCMATHCLDVLKSYLYKAMCRNEANDYENLTHPASCSALALSHIDELESVITQSKYLNEHSIPISFINLLNVLLLIWFILLPFSVVEISGWFTILWVMIISYGVLGVHSIATEIQFPFGTDLNDLDLDSLADAIVFDVINTSILFNARLSSLISKQKVLQIWQIPEGVIDKPRLESSVIRSIDELKEKSQVNNMEPTMLQRTLESIQLALHIMNWWVMFAYLIWAAIVVAIAYVVGRYWPFFDFPDQPELEAQLESACSIWFCSKISIGSSVLNYIGFALFLLLGFQLYDSHERYTQAIEAWQEKMFHVSGAGLSRALDCFTTGLLHDGEMGRMAGFLAAYPTCVMGSLRGEDYKEKLLEILDEHDVNLILSQTDKANFCFDVYWSYVVKMERLSRIRDPSICQTSAAEISCAMGHVHNLKLAALECQEIIRNPLPFGYIQHLKIFIVTYLILLPLGLVDSSGWITILWVVIISYGTFASERWANELSNPFGHDLSDIPLESLCESILTTVKDTYNSYKQNLLHKNRRFDTLVVKDRNVNDVHVPSLQAKKISDSDDESH